MADQGFAQKGENTASQDSKVQPRAGNPLVDEKLFDPESSFLPYECVRIEVACGDRPGDVFTFSHKNHLNLNKDLLDFYKDGLKTLIETKKYLIFLDEKRDVGPTVAIARIIEDGDYANFLQIFNTQSITFDGFEHIFVVREGDVTYHIVPQEYFRAFSNLEQYGLIGYSISKSHCDPSNDEERRKVEDRWQEHAKEFDEILSACLNDSNMPYEKCFVYKNLSKRLRETYLAEDPHNPE
jgi:hypothetical protein